MNFVVSAEQPTLGRFIPLLLRVASPRITEFHTTDGRFFRFRALKAWNAFPLCSCVVSKCAVGQL